MKKLLVKNSLIACLFTLPLLADAITLQSNVASNTFKFIGQNTVNANVATVLVGRKNLGQFGSFSIISDNGDLLSIAYLADESTDNNKFKSDAKQTDSAAEIKHNSDVVSVPSALPLLAVAIGIFCFGANRRRV